MNCLITYGSQYGTAKRYAEKMAEMTGIAAKNYEDVKSLSDYDKIIHFGSLYAGGVTGLKQTAKILPPDTEIIIVTVGLADVHDDENINNIRTSISGQIPPEIYDRAKIFHLRGGIDYKHLNFKHKTMMKLMYNKVKKMPEEERNAEVRAMIETYGQKVDFVDFHALREIVDALK